MNVIVCLDNRNGMLFNNRRQSRDRLLNAYILDLVGNSTFYIHDFSSDLFADAITNNNCLIEAKENDFCFIENQSLLPYEDQIKRIYLFKWNRNYPGDVYFDLDLSHYSCVETHEFAGSSHECITLEVWEK